MTFKPGDLVKYTGCVVVQYIDQVGKIIKYVGVFAGEHTYDVMFYDEEIFTLIERNLHPVKKKKLHV